MIRRLVRCGGVVLLVIVVALVVVVAVTPYLRRIALLGDADVRDYDKLPFRVIGKSATPISLPVNTGGDWTAPLGLAYRDEPIGDEEGLARFLEARGTTAFIAIADGEIIEERYFNGFARDSLFKSFSISKSVLSALIGIAIDEGLIGLDDPVTNHVPEMEDVRFRRVTVRHCLDNTTGIRYTRGVMPWTTRPRMYYSTDIRRYLLESTIAREPGTTFTTDELSPLVLGLVLERALRRTGAYPTISAYFEAKIWHPIGAEFDALWNLDHEHDGLEKTESGFTARAIDLAKLGCVYLEDGTWGGRQVVPPSWVRDTTIVKASERGPNIEDQGFYKRLWWGQASKEHVRPDFYANGHFGQRLYVSPARNLVLLRLGYADGGVGWTGFLSSIAERFRAASGSRQRTERQDGSRTGNGQGSRVDDGRAPETNGSVSITRLSDRVRLLSAGAQNANVTAIRTSAGIVLVDSGESIELGREIRHVLAREFPGAAVTHIVNTHAHWDHVLGNAAFPEATIVAHENCLKALVRLREPIGAGETREKRLADRRPPPPRSGIPPPPPRTPLEVHLLPDVYALTVPDVTFTDRHVIESGGVRFDLIYYGPAHTRSDVLVLVPEERLLFVGDLYYRTTLPSFSQTVPPDVEAWRRALDRVLAAPARFDRVVSGHGEVIPRAEFEAQVHYLFEVWARAGEAVRDGESLQSLQQGLRLETAFPNLAALDVRSSTGGSLHEGNVRNAWRHQGGRTKRGSQLRVRSFRHFAAVPSATSASAARRR